MFDFNEMTKGNLIAFKVHGKIEVNDYDKLTALLDKAERENESLKLLVEIGDIEGITGKAFLKDVATYFKHIRHVEKIAVVGDGDYKEGTWTKIAKPFMKADIQYFPRERKTDAEAWIAS